MLHFEKKDQKMEFHSLAKIINFQGFWEFWKNAGLWQAVVPEPIHLQYTQGTGKSIDCERHKTVLEKRMLLRVELDPSGYHPAGWNLFKWGN